MTLPSAGGHPVGQHPLIVRLLKGIFNYTPPKPRYSKRWKVSTLSNHISSLPDNNDLSQLILSEKLVSLLALVTAQRTQTLAALDLQYFDFSDNCCYITVRELLKTNCPKRVISNNKLTLPAFEGILTNKESFGFMTSCSGLELTFFWLSFEHAYPLKTCTKCYVIEFKNYVNMKYNLNSMNNNEVQVEEGSHPT